MNSLHKKILIIGGVAGGATAAARVRRLDEHAEITILEKGKYVSFANCGLPYFISRDIQKRSRLLLQTPEGFFSRYRVNVRVNTEAIEIKRDKKIVIAKTETGMEEIPYDSLLLAQGGSPVIPNIPGNTSNHVFKLWTIPDMDRIHKFIEEQKPSKAVIVGGGFIGLEMAEALHARGLSVTVVEAASQVMITMDTEFSTMIKHALEGHGIRVITGNSLKEIHSTTATLQDGSSIETDMVLFSIGVRPELTLAKAAGLDIGASGGLLVNDMLRTNDPNIYAAGDMIEVVNKIHGHKVRIPLAGPANRQGRIAATNMLGGAMHYRGALGSSVVKVFQYTGASTGLTEKAARDSGFDAGVSYVFKDHHVSYYPDSKQLALKIVYDKKTMRLLGGQAFGEAGVEKRIDVLATALQGKMTLEDLSEIDLAYAPPFNGANDPVNLAAFVGLNDITQYSPSKTPAEVLIEIKNNGGIVLDVRTFGEQSKAPLETALHIPADEIRDRLEEVPKDKTIYLFSKDGFLGHTTLQVLKANGWNRFYNITGGYLAARWFQDWKLNI